MTTIIFATTNSGKITSLRKSLDRAGLQDIKIEARSLNLIEPQADSCEEVASSKAQQAYRLLGAPVLVDDSSFHITALGGFPGVYAKYMNDTLGAEGIVDFMKGKADRSAHFAGVLVYVDEQGERHMFHASPYHGTIAETIGTMKDGVAWSVLHKIFIPTGSNKVMGEMSSEDFAKVKTDDGRYGKFAVWLKDRQGV